MLQEKELLKKFTMHALFCLALFISNADGT